MITKYMDLESGSFAVGLFLGFVAGILVSSIVTYVITNMLKEKEIKILRNEKGEIVGAKYV